MPDGPPQAASRQGRGIEGKIRQQIGQMTLTQLGERAMLNFVSSHDRAHFQALPVRDIEDRPHGPGNPGKTAREGRLNACGPGLLGQIHAVAGLQQIDRTRFPGGPE